MHDIPWPNNARCAVRPGFDVDGEAGRLGPKREHQTRLSALSRAALGPDVGVPWFGHAIEEPDKAVAEFRARGGLERTSAEPPFRGPIFRSGPRT